MVSAFWTIATRWWPQAVPSQTFNLNFMLQGYGKEVKTWRNVIGQKLRCGDIKMNIVPAPGQKHRIFMQYGIGRAGTAHSL